MNSTAHFCPLSSQKARYPVLAPQVHLLFLISMQISAISSSFLSGYVSVLCNIQLLISHNPSKEEMLLTITKMT